MLAAMAHAHAARDRRGDEPRKLRGAEGTASDGKAAYLADVKSSSSQMKRPSAGASLSWRYACPQSRHHFEQACQQWAAEVEHMMYESESPCPASGMFCWAWGHAAWCVTFMKGCQAGMECAYGGQYHTCCPAHSEVFSRRSNALPSPHSSTWRNVIPSDPVHTCHNELTHPGNNPALLDWDAVLV